MGNWTIFMRRLDFYYIPPLAAPVKRQVALVKRYRVQASVINSVDVFIEAGEGSRHEYGVEWALGIFIARDDLAVGV